MSVPLCQAPHSEAKRPSLVAPKGATDSHVHIFGPESKYPFVRDRKYTPPDASPGAYRALAALLGIERVVLVQPSIYGIDNSRQFDSVRELGMPARVVAVLPIDIPDSELRRLHALGGRAVRFVASQPGGLPVFELERFSQRLHEQGWHIELMLTAAQVVELEPRIAKLRCRTVIDHMGSIEAGAGLGQPAFAALLRLVSNGCWTKLSAAYRLSAVPLPYSDVAQFATRLIEARPDRVIWGSDWPQAYFSGVMPNSADLLDTLLAWAPAEDRRKRILVDNAADLYGF